MVQRHDNVADKTGELCKLALTPSRISYEPDFFSGKDIVAGQRRKEEARQEEGGDKEKAKGGNEAGDKARGDVSVHGLWKRD